MRKGGEDFDHGEKNREELHEKVVYRRENRRRSAQRNEVTERSERKLV